jgi:chromate transporter
MAVIVQALLGLGRTALKNLHLGLIAAVALIATGMLGVHELVILAAAGGAAGLTAWWRQRPEVPAIFPLPLWTWSDAGLLVASGALAVPVALKPLFLVFLKAGALLFGSGYVLLAFLRADLVERLHWLSNAQLLDAIAVGQITPGPVFTTATFIGYVLAGGPGAVAATLGIFLPAFVFVAASAPVLPAMRRSPIAAAVLDAVNVASLALMAAVTLQLARDAVMDLPTAALAVTSGILLWRCHVNPAWLALGGAAVGLTLR